MRYIAYSISPTTNDLIRVAVCQSSSDKAVRDAKSHSISKGESWLYAADKGQILIGHYLGGLSVPLTPPVLTAPIVVKDSERMYELGVKCDHVDDPTFHCQECDDAYAEELYQLWARESDLFDRSALPTGISREC